MIDPFPRTRIIAFLDRLHREALAYDTLGEPPAETQPVPPPEDPSPPEPADDSIEPATDQDGWAPPPE